MAAGRGSPSSPCCRVSGTSNYKTRLSFDKKTGGGEGWSGRKRSEAGRGLFLGQECVPPKALLRSFTVRRLLRCLEGEMPPFPRQRGISKTQSTEEDITGNFFSEFCFNFSESWGSNAPENTPVTRHWLYIFCKPHQCKSKGWDPWFYTQGESDIKDTKI